MCGIAGFFERRRRQGAENGEAIIRDMTATLAHRGPDDSGTWLDSTAGVALGHRRLAILDLSQEGHQPMHSADGRYVLVFNGEIYNFGALRATLARCGHVFRGRSDTEVMLAAFCQWGLVPALERCSGMFAFALWDRRERRLHLGRDRAGEKPLYCGWIGEAFAFGSELKALRAHPNWSGGIDREALALLIRYGYIPAPFCIYAGISKVPAGCVLTLDDAQVKTRSLPRPEPYWSLETVAQTGSAQPFKGTAREAGGRLHALLLAAVDRQMVADVPIGAFLSGGVDSSLVVALMQAQSARPIKTFSIGFPQADFDEAPFAKAVARHLGTDHTEFYVRPSEALAVVPSLPEVYDEPLADPSQVPTVLLCRLARTQVKVSLSGDAGDELFGGYLHYRKARLLWSACVGIPTSIRRRLAASLQSLCHSGLVYGAAANPMRPFLHRLSNFAQLLPAPDDWSLYQLLLSPSRDPGAWLDPSSETDSRARRLRMWDQFPDLLNRMLAQDFVAYLPDDILVKVDRAAMRVGLETRIPLLDPAVIEFAWRLPSALKLRGRQGKWLVRQLLHRYLPPALIDRPKRGFAAPIGDWLRGPLRPWAESLLTESRLRGEGFFNPRGTRQKWEEHLRGTHDWSAGLWHVLMFQAWLDHQKRRPNQAAKPAWAEVGQRDEIQLSA